MAMASRGTELPCKLSLIRVFLLKFHSSRDSFHTIDQLTDQYWDLRQVVATPLITPLISQCPYLHHYNLLFITNHSWIVIVHKNRSLKRFYKIDGLWKSWLRKYKPQVLNFSEHLWQYKWLSEVAQKLVIQCNLDLVTLNLVTTCDLVTIF